jgi:phosphoglycerate dehydrogenase-like enzyme
VTILVLIHSPFAMWTIPDADVDRLRREFPAHTFLHARDDTEGRAFIGDAEVAFSSQVSADLLSAATRLRWIHSPAAGVAGMLYPALIASDIVITNSRGLSAETIAEHVLAVTLALFRRVPLAVTRQREKIWAQDEIGGTLGNRLLSGAHVVIVGLGAIGAATATRLTALGARVTGVRRRTNAPAVAGVASVRPPGDLLAVLPSADVVVIAAPQTKQTRGLIGRREIDAMKADAILVNVSRGGLVDEDALAGALRSGRIAGAALDVFRNEPLDSDSEIWDLPNLLITPHTSGFRPEHWDAATALFADNLRRFDRGDELLNIVDKEQGY